MYMSAFLGKAAELPLDGSYIINNFQNALQHCGEKLGKKAVLADTSGTYGGSK